MILEDNTSVHVNNPKKIKTKHGGVVVSEPERKKLRLFLRSARLQTSLIPILSVTCKLFIFIYILAASVV